MQYSVFELNGRQYLIEPGKTIEVDLLGADKTLKVDNVLLRVDDDKVDIGTPFLKESLELEVVGNIKKDKIRVAKFHAKANYRKVIGSRRQMTLLRLTESVKSKVQSQKSEEIKTKRTKKGTKTSS